MRHHMVSTTVINHWKNTVFVKRFWKKKKKKKKKERMKADTILRLTVKSVLKSFTNQLRFWY